MTASYQNGNQEAVLGAIQQGVSEPKAIATRLSLDVEAVKNAIKRLNKKGLIRRKNLGGYEPAHNAGHLGGVWK